MSEGFFDQTIQKAADWVANKLSPGGFPTVPSSPSNYYAAEPGIKTNITKDIRHAIATPEKRLIHQLKTGETWSIKNGDELIIVDPEAPVKQGNTISRSWIFRAWEQRDKMSVAVKTLSRDVGGDYLAEVEALQKNQSGKATPKLIAFNDLITRPNGVNSTATVECAAITMEWLDGPNLDQLLRERGPLNPNDVIQKLEIVADTIDNAEIVGTNHGDVNPKNIIDTPDGYKLPDWGSTRLASRETITANFTAPELKLENAKPTHKGDIYSLGATIYKLITGETPSQNLRSLTTFRHLSEKIHLEQLQKIDQIITSALSFNPDDRPQSAMSMIQDLLHAINYFNIHASL